MNPRTGLVRRLAEMRPEAGDPRIHILGADVGDPVPLGGTGPISASGAAGWTLAEARAATIGEAIERYAAAIPDPDGLRVATARELPGAVTDWALFSRAQYDHPQMHFVPFNEDLRLSWVAARRLTAGPTREAWVPAHLVYLPFPSDEPTVAPSMSTGLAAGPDLTSATLSALYEIVERDAFTLTWLTRAVPPPIDEAAWPARVRRLARHGRLRLFDLTSDLGIPVVVAYLERESDVGTVRVIGAAARHAAHAAMEKAALEAFQTVPYVRDLVRKEPDWEAGPRFENLRDFRDHARFYTVHPEHVAGLGPFRDNVKMPIVPRDAEGVERSKAGRVADLLDRLVEKGLDAYRVDLTTRDVAAAGLHVVRVLSPQAQPLHGFYQVPHLGSKRLEDAHLHLPFLDTPFAIEEVNRWPHPFA